MENLPLARLRPPADSGPLGTVQAPTGVDVTQTRVQTSVLLVTNTVAAYRVITAPGGAVKSSGTWAVTNLTEITTTVYPRLVTNMVCLPIF